MKPSGWLFALLGTSVFPQISYANDGGIAMGGSPKLLSGHPSVKMTSEVILMKVTGEHVEVDCNFVFTNTGKKCVVRMGFPDQGYGASDPDEDKSLEGFKITPPETTFDSFKSWVDGNSVPTNLIRADKPGQFWHTKTVTFPAHSVIKIRDLYTQSIGGGITKYKTGYGNARQVAYILHTGSSWHGSIGKSMVIVRLMEPWTTEKTLILKSESSVTDSHDGRGLNINPTPNLVLWTGPCKPVVDGRTLTFVRNNWRPKSKDDIHITYHFTMADK